MINIDNQSGGRQTTAQTAVPPTNNNGIIRKIVGFVIVGFIKFTEGYYIVLVTKQLPVAILGYHVIYTIEDVSMIYVPYVRADKASNKEINLDEQK